MSNELVVKTKDELLQAFGEMRNAAQANDGRLANLEKGVEVLTGKMRDLRNLHTAAQTYTPSGNDAEAYSRYTVDAELVKPQVAGPGDLVQYAAPEQNRGGTEYLAGKEAPRAIRMLSEWDELGNRDPGLLDDPEPVTPWQHRFQQLAEQRTLARIFLARANSRGEVRMGATPKTDAALRRHVQRGPDWVKQVFADNSGEGADFIPDVVLPELSRRLELPRNVMAQFPTMQIPTGGTTQNPFLIAGCQPFIVGTPASGDLDPADIVRSVPSTTSLTHAPKTWGVTLPASRDATEDSIIEWGSFANMLLAEAIRDGEEDAAINADPNGGDTGLANWNIRSRWNTLGNANDHRKSFVGFRQFSIDVSSHSALSTESVVGIIAELISLDSPQFMDDVIIVTSPEFVLLKLLTDTNLLTVDKYGALATILTGEVGRIMGRPLIMSEFVDVQYNTSGVYDDSTKTKTGVLAINRSRWAKGLRRGPRVEAEVVAKQHTTYLTLTERWTLRHLGRSTEKSVGWYYNATAS